ncbi:hypothetical protein SNEBB_007710 [Seison nebaliae]|nr:hypothetical protein SNEBB_007710 [Seison nebaliae]
MSRVDYNCSCPSPKINHADSECQILNYFVLTFNLTIFLFVSILLSVYWYRYISMSRKRKFKRYISAYEKPKITKSIKAEEGQLLISFKTDHC